MQRVDDLDLVASLQFKAKTASFAARSPFALVQADMKCFQSTSGDSRTRSLLRSSDKRSPSLMHNNRVPYR